MGPLVATRIVTGLVQGLDGAVNWRVALGGAVVHAPAAQPFGQVCTRLQPQPSSHASTALPLQRRLPSEHPLAAQAAPLQPHAHDSSTVHPHPPASQRRRSPPVQVSWPGWHAWVTQAPPTQPQSHTGPAVHEQPSAAHTSRRAPLQRPEPGEHTGGRHSPATQPHVQSSATEPCQPPQLSFHSSSPSWQPVEAPDVGRHLPSTHCDAHPLHVPQ